MAAAWQHNNGNKSRSNISHGTSWRFVGGGVNIDPRRAELRRLANAAWFFLLKKKIKNQIFKLINILFIHFHK